MSDENGTVMTTGASGAEDTAAYDQAKNAEQNSPAGNQPADDTKVADDAGATDTPDGKAEGDDGDGDKAPEDYADFDIPEGVTVADADVDAFKGLAKDAGLNQEQAQKLLTFEAERIRAMNDQYAEQQAQQVQDWAASAKADKEIGGDAFDENVATAVKAMDTFATPESQGDAQRNRPWLPPRIYPYVLENRSVDFV